MQSPEGKFIVIDGTDGSGKTTQLELLATALRQNGYQVELADFPQYNQKSAGLVEEYLGGRYGNADEVGPYVASIFYAVDRYDASFKIRKWLSEGRIVLSNRYVSANMGHQGGKIDNSLERKAYFDWLYKLEFGLFNLPKPDLNLILHVPAEVAQKLAETRAREDYTGKTKDIHEENIDHLKKAEQTYLDIANSFPGFTLVSCSTDGQIKDRQVIHELVWQQVEKLIEPKDNNLNIIEVEKINSQAKLPVRGHDHDAGLDLFSVDYYSIMPGERMLIQTGIRINIPKGHAGLIWDKSGVSSYGVKTLGGVIDAGYRGEIKIGLINLSQDPYHIAPGQKVAQLLIQKISTPSVRETTINTDTARGENNYGSTGLF